MKQNALYFKQLYIFELTQFVFKKLYIYTCIHQNSSQSASKSAQ